MTNQCRMSLFFFFLCQSFFGTLAAQAPGATPLRGDVDGGGSLNITDAINLLRFLFVGGPAPYCESVADANGDGSINISDPLYILNFLFSTGAGLPELTDEERDACINHPPTVPSRGVYRTYPGYPVELPIGALDPDGNALRYSVVDFPAGASLDELTGVVQWTPEQNQLGPFYLRFNATDDGLPPASVEGTLVFLVLPLDPCNDPECAPGAGCRAALRPLAEECCNGEPEVRVAEPDVGCPEGEVLHVGRNKFVGFGRLQNCDYLSTPNLGQGGVGVSLHFEARCVESLEPVTVRVRLETADVLLVDVERTWLFQDRDDGFAEIRARSFPIPPAESQSIVEGAPADLTVTLTDFDGVTLERKLRLVLTKERQDDLPN